MTQYFTQQGLTDAKKRLKHLETTSRKEIAEKIRRAKEMGDLKENAEYHAAKEAQAFLEHEIAKLKETIREAKIISKSSSSSDTVVVGSTMTIQNSSKKKITYTIVGPSEADPGNGKISDQSPIGKALLGASKGETVSVELPDVAVKYKIVSIN